MADARKPDPLGGFVSGVAGGLAGGAVKMLCEVVAPPRPPDREAEPAVLLSKIARVNGESEPTEAQKQNATLLIHFAFSALGGGLYGALVEVWPRVGIGRGAGYGIAIWIGAHEMAMPALGLTPPTNRLPPSEQINECITHAIFGCTLEAVRGIAREIIGNRAE